MKTFQTIVALAVFLTTASYASVHQSSESQTVMITSKIHQYNGKNSRLYSIYAQPGVLGLREPLEIDSAGHSAFSIASSIPMSAMTRSIGILSLHVFHI